jgi:hypothetical protein
MIFLEHRAVPWARARRKFSAENYSVSRKDMRRKKFGFLGCYFFLFGFIFNLLGVFLNLGTF